VSERSASFVGRLLFTLGVAGMLVSAGYLVVF
jgi:hypothetical protein